MGSPIWYLGPDWDMRPLVCPEPDLDITVEQFGGVFQGLSGARTKTYTGAKQRFNMQLRFLEPAEFEFLEALNVRAIPGPFRLRSPLGKNLLSAHGSLLRPVPGFYTTGQGIAVQGGTLTKVMDWPTAAPALGAVAAKWTPGSNYARIDSRHMFPVTPGQQVTMSVYWKGDSAVNAWIVADWYDKFGVQLTSVNTGNLPVTTSWVRQSYTVTPPAGAYTARMAFWSASATPVYLAAAQAEYGASATTWELGGSAPRVILSSLETTSPRYPYVHATLSLLEA